MQMSGMEQQSHSNSATSATRAATSGSMNDHDTQQQRVSGTDMATMDDALTNPSNSGSTISLGIVGTHTPSLNVHSSVTHRIDETNQLDRHDGESPGDASSSSSSATEAAAVAASPSAASASSSSSVSESMSTSASVEHQRRSSRKRTLMARGVEQTDNQWTLRVQRERQTNDADADKTGDKDEEQKNLQHSAVLQSPSIPLSIAQRFHLDGLHSIFRCLTMRELNATAQTCKSWYAASIAPSFCIGWDLMIREDHQSFHSSPLRNHVISLRLDDEFTVSQPSQLNLAALNGVEKLGLGVTLNDHQPSPTSSLSLLPPRLTLYWI